MNTAKYIERQLIERLAAFAADRDYAGVREAADVLVSNVPDYGNATVREGAESQSLAGWLRWPTVSPSADWWGDVCEEWLADRDCPGMVGEWTLQGAPMRISRDGDDEEKRGAAVIVTSPEGGCWTGTVCPTWGDDPENTDDWIILEDEHHRQHEPPVQLIEPLEQLGRECPEQGPMMIVWEISSDGEGRRVA